MNQVFIKGNVGQDADVKETKNGKPYVNVSIATSRKGRGDDEWLTDWHRVTVWGKQAKPVKKGQIAFVQGSYIETQWKDKDGNDRKGHQVNAFEMMVTDRPGSSSSSSNDSNWEEENIDF